MKFPSMKSAFIALALVAIPCLSHGQSGSSQQAPDQAACQEHAKLSSGYDRVVSQTTAPAARHWQCHGTGGSLRAEKSGGLLLRHRIRLVQCVPGWLSIPSGRWCAQP